MISASTVQFPLVFSREIKSIITRAYTEFGKATGCQTRLLNLDDLLNEEYSRVLCDLITEGSHHRNLRLILITQSISPKQALSGHFVER
jgi:hypothetical protein